jgi:hypothetical protein
VKGNKILSAIYDKMLYSYAYMEIFLNQTWDRIVDYRRNVKWVKKNGAYRG